MTLGSAQRGICFKYNNIKQIVKEHSIIYISLPTETAVEKLVVSLYTSEPEERIFEIGTSQSSTFQSLCLGHTTC